MNSRTTSLLLAGTIATVPLPLPQAAAADAAFSTAGLGGGDNDGNVGLSSGKVYHNAVNVFGGALTINGVAFEASAGANPSGSTYSISGVPNTLGSGGTNLVGGQLGSLVNDFIYAGNPGQLTLGGLTPGESYALTFYDRAWSNTNRSQLITTSSGASATINQDFNPTGELNLIRYTFTATAASENISFQPLDGGSTFHFYGFSTERIFSNQFLGGSDWSSGSWSGTTPNAAGSNADFAAAASPTSLNLDAPATLGHARFAGSNPWTISGAAALTLQADAGAVAVLSATSGNHTLATPLTLNSEILKSGSGTITLTGPFTGNGQRLNLGAGTLAFSHASPQSHSGEITGSGALLKAGSGTLTLTGPVNHTGPTTIEAGTLEISNNSATSLRTQLAGTGNFTKSGTGTLTITLPNSHSGPTNIASGTLRLQNGETHLLTDSFSATGNPNTYDINYNLANRQSGTAATQS